jgi:AcrR family transcriptional regulator
MSPKIVNKEEKVRQILDAAKMVLSKKGYVKTTMQDIARQAGMGKGTLYEYFPSKESIFVGIIDAFFEEYLEIFHQIHELSIEKGFRFILETLFIIPPKEDQNLHLMMHIYGHRSEVSHGIFFQRIKKYYQEFLDTLDRFIRRGQQQKKISSAYPADILARSIMSTLDGLMLQLMLFPESIESRREEYIQYLTDQWIK